MVLCLSQDGACTDLFENFREKSLKQDLSNGTTANPPLFSLVNTFNNDNWKPILVNTVNGIINGAVTCNILQFRQCVISNCYATKTKPFLRIVGRSYN